MVAAAGTTYVLAWADGTSVSEDAAAVRDKVESESSPPVVSVFTEDPSLRPNGVAGVVTGSTGSDSLAEPRPNGSTEETTRDWSAFPSATQAQVTSALRPWLSACVLAWVVGMALGATRILAGGLQVHRLRRNGLSIVSDEIAQILDETAARLRVRIPVRIKESSLVAGPVVIRWSCCPAVR